MPMYIFSTLSCDQRYVAYTKGGGDIPVEAGAVVIRGGSNVADKRLVTSIGVVTEVTDEQYALLEANEVFKLHRANGFITAKTKKVEPEAVAADMATRDGSAPLTDADLEAQAKEAAATGRASSTVVKKK